MNPTDTTVDEIADGIYRISTPVPPSDFPGGFSYNRYLVADDEPLLFHLGHRKLFETTAAAVARIVPVESLRWLSFSHLEADECGALNQFLAAAPKAVPLCGRVAAMVSIGDYADREPRALADGETVSLGRHTVRWVDAPHTPHNWECGFLMEEATRTLFCGDLFTQPGADTPALTEDDILGPSEAMREALDYYAHATNCGENLERLAALEPKVLACMHGSAFAGDGGAALRALAKAITDSKASIANQVMGG
jgi:flavorubredoxin